ncbi:MAG TPA: hypothetical protein PK216_14890, partial [Aquimonas sp.]|nr:hypothetical protein [Aquimonas sp.]
MSRTRSTVKAPRRSRSVKTEANETEDNRESGRSSRSTRKSPTRRARPDTSSSTPDAATSYESLLRAACIRAGTAAAVSSLGARIPVLGWVAPSVLSIFTD